MLAKKTLELNPHHPVIKEMLNKVKTIADNEDDVETLQDLVEYADMIYNMALLNSGFIIDNPTDFTIPMQKLLKVGFGLRKDAPIEEIEVDISSDEEEITEEIDYEEEGEVEMDDLGEEEEIEKNDEL